jgi:hypothetical protein
METTGRPPRRELKGHENRSGTTVHAWPSVAFGCVFTLAGASTGFFLLRDPSVAATNRLLGLLAALLFAVCGLSFVIHGLLGLRRETRAREGKLSHPHEPWRWDHPWETTGPRDDAVTRPFTWLWRSGFLVLFLLPFNYFILFGDDFPLWARIVFGLFIAGFDLLALYTIYRLVHALLQLVRYGSGRLSLDRFPLFPGETFDVYLRPGRPLPATTLTATLRCVEERYETRGRGENRSQQVVSYELYADSKTVHVSPSAVGYSGIRLRFEIPPGTSNLPGTRLSERPPTYWELRLDAASPGADYEATFLIPVYTKGQVQG